MTDFEPREDPAGYGRVSLSRRALKALSGPEGITGGALSPLAAMEAPAGAGAADELISAWGSLDGAWKWSVPALVDPHRTVAFLLGDGNLNVVGQYLFPDADGCGPGFEVEVEEHGVELAGPLSLGELKIGFYSRLDLEEVAEPEPFRMNLPADHFRVLAACLDAYRSAALGRRLLRMGGAPPGVALAEIVEAWADGTSMLNPGWAVSLLSFLSPATAPQDLAVKLPRLLRKMSRQGYLKEVGDAGSGQTLYSFASGLAPLLWGLTTALNFGVAAQRLVLPQAAEVTILMGWRSARGIWLADLGDMENGGVTLILAGPMLATDLIDEALGDESLAPPWDEFVMETPYGRDAMISRLRRLQAGEEAEAAGRGKGEPPAPSFCTRCGSPLVKGAAFCRKCGTAVPRQNGKTGGEAGKPQPSCPNCGYVYPGGTRFCRECGARL